MKKAKHVGFVTIIQPPFLPWKEYLARYLTSCIMRNRINYRQIDGLLRIALYQNARLLHSVSATKVLSWGRKRVEI